MVGLVWGGGYPPIHVQVNGALSDGMKRARKLAKKKGINFTGDAAKGKFSGLVSGSYTATGNDVKIIIKSIPFYISYETVEHELRTFFE